MLIFFTLVCAALSVFWIASPLLWPHEEASAGGSSSLAELETECAVKREAVFSQLEELEESFIGQKISPEDYEKEKQRLVILATECLNNLEQLEAKK